MSSLILASIFFIVIHLGVAGTKLRDAIVGATGERVFSMLFSVASVVGLVWMIWAYKGSETSAVWGQSDAWKLLSDVLMLPAFVLVVAGLLTRNPTSIGQERAVADVPSGIVTVTRHPFLMGVALWALLHLIANGDSASIVFFGGFLIVAAAGAPSIDAKRQRKLGRDAWEAFARRTSILPFAAITTGRSRFDVAGIGWWRIGLGVLAYVLFIGGHRHIIGVSPFPIS